MLCDITNRVVGICANVDDCFVGLFSMKLAPLHPYTLNNSPPTVRHLGANAEYNHLHVDVSTLLGTRTVGEPTKRGVTRPFPFGSHNDT